MSLFYKDEEFSFKRLLAFFASIIFLLYGVGSFVSQFYGTQIDVPTNVSILLGIVFGAYFSKPIWDRKNKINS